MKTLFIAIILVIIAFAAALAYGEMNAPSCHAKLQGGQGNSLSPLEIQLSGNCGIFPMIDKYLPVRVVPAIKLTDTDAHKA